MVRTLQLAAALAVAGQASAVMNAGGQPYRVGNAGPEYSTEFTKESPEYFDSYSQVTTKYSQVFWTRSPNIPLPAEIVERFAGKVMAITGYEVDQVMNPHVVNGTCLTDLCKKSDLSVPIYNAYNHHYFGWLMGNNSELYKLDEPTLGMNPTNWGIRDSPSKPAAQKYPTNIVFKENPGGEYRKSYHGYPHGYAQLLHSPSNFVCEPMQIDTHNRLKGNATEITGHQPSFLPKSIDGRDGTISGENLHSGLSPLIECPCSDRIFRFIKNSSEILTSSKCQHVIATEAECRVAVELVAPVSGSSSTANASMAPGCTMRPTPAKGAGTFMALFNSLPKAKATGQCGSAGPTVRGPFSWGARQNGTQINCGSTDTKACMPQNATYGCEKTSAKQCVWKEEAAARKGCGAAEDCDGFFCSSEYTLPALKACPKGTKCPTICFGRSSTATAKATLATSFSYTKQYVHPSPADFLTGASLAALQGAALVNVTLAHDGRDASITLTGPAAVWYGVGWDAQKMADLPYAIVVDGTGKVSERKLGSHQPGTVLAASVLVKSNTVAGGVRTVVLTRRVAGASKDHYTFPSKAGAINLITAVGSSAAFSYHKARTGAKLTLLPTQVDACMCAPITTEYMSYMNESTAAFHYNCVEEPRGDMAHGQRDASGKLLHNGKLQNPACQMETYHGGLRCCHHEWFLTDLEQNGSIPLDQPEKNKHGLIPGIASVDTYFLKWRFYFQEYTKGTPEPPHQVEKKEAVAPATDGENATHLHLHHWVFLIDQQVNDYEESQEGVATNTPELTTGTITAHLQAKDMGLEDIPKHFTGITPLVMTPHCHAPSCLSQELWNKDTGELLCRSLAYYGTGKELYNEKDYVAIPPCLWGYQPGLKKPMTISPDTNLTAIKYFNNTFRHMGQMAQWTGLMVYEGEVGGRPY